MSIRHVVSLGSVAGAVLAITACGGADYAPKAPDSHAGPAEVDPVTVEEAQARIERARLSLAGSGGLSVPSTGAAPTTPSTPPAPGADSSVQQAPAKSAEPPKASSTKKPAPDSPTPTETPHEVEDRCTSPCRALVSMRRAVTALCRMTGDTDTRCVDAKKTLSDSEGRVSPCSC